MSNKRTDFAAWFAAQHGKNESGFSSATSSLNIPEKPTLFDNIKSNLYPGSQSSVLPTNTRDLNNQSFSDSSTSTIGSVSNTASAAFSGVFSSLRNAAGVGEATSEVNEWTFGLSYTQRLQIFFILCGGSIILYLLAIFVFLPVIIISPSKFATAFTFASILWILGLAVLKGPKSTLQNLFQRDRLPFTLAYISSILLSLYATIYSQSYFLIILAVIVQFAVSAFYITSFIPGGTAAMGSFARVGVSSARYVFR